MLDKFINIFDELNKIPDPPYDYEFMMNLPENEYPKYLKKLYFYKTSKKLNLKNPKRFEEKIQWLKIYDNLPLKTSLTDKVLVREWIKNKIGSEYLKPVLWVGSNFDDIPFESLPNSFMLKTNHGCRWNYAVKDKEKFLQNKVLFEIVKKRINDWMHASFFPFGGFELQYRNIVPQIMVEELLREDSAEMPMELEIYCFNEHPKIFQKIIHDSPAKVCIFNDKYENIDLKFSREHILIDESADDLLKQAVNLSKLLCQGFKLVRIDWLINKNKLYFNEMTFTPYSGFYSFPDIKVDLKLGKMLKLK